MTILAGALPYLSTITIIFAIGLTIGGFAAAFRNGRQVQLTSFQQAAATAQGAANTALQQRIEALEGRIEDFEKENIVQRHIIDTVIAALKQQYGILITIDGDMVSISDASGSASTHRKRRTPQAPPGPPSSKKEEK